MKEDKIIGLYQAENELLKQDIRMLNRELEHSKAVATKFEKEVEEQDAEIERRKLTLKQGRALYCDLTAKKTDLQKNLTIGKPLCISLVMIMRRSWKKSNSISGKRRLKR